VSTMPIEVDGRAGGGHAERPVAVELCGVVSTVDGFPVLADVDLRVVSGEVVLVSGPNGAGKTSLLRLLAGLLPVREGRACVLGHDLAVDAVSHRRRVAFVAQETFCYDDLPVRRNLHLHARAAGVAMSEADRAMEVLELGPVADVPHGRLSTGQRRRCGLAVGLARCCDLLLLDEPHAGLDEAARTLVDRAVDDARGHGVTVLLSSHELDRARALADREVPMVAGCTVSQLLK
jgi:ABC-type multidrug transport system ATPase subunit